MLSTEIPGLLQLSGVLGCGEEGLMGLLAFPILGGHTKWHEVKQFSSEHLLFI